MSNYNVNSVVALENSCTFIFFPNFSYLLAKAIVKTLLKLWRKVEEEVIIIIQITSNCFEWTYLGSELEFDLPGHLAVVVHINHVD